MGAQQRYPRLSGVDAALQRRPLSGGGEGGALDPWLGGIYGPPVYDHTVGIGGEASFDIDLSTFQDADDLLACFRIRSTSSGSGYDETRLTLNADTTDANYDYPVFYLGGQGPVDNSRRWPNVPNADVAPVIWFTGVMEIIAYSEAIKHTVETFGRGGPKGTADLLSIRNRHHVAAAILGMQINTVSGLLQEGSRFTAWREYR